MRTHLPFFIAAVLFTGCGLETEPNPDYQAGTGAGAGANSGSGGDAGGQGGDGGGSGGSGGDAGGDGGSGGNGGTAGGGQGGDSSVEDCDDNTDCAASLPQCNAGGECVSCTSNAACEERGMLAHCETTVSSDRRGQCVECIEDEHCEGSDNGEYCNNNACVPCESNGDCDDVTKPQCSAEGQCVGCTGSDACEDRVGTEICQTNAGPKRGHCVACIGNNDCPDADAPQCKTDNTCGDCTDNAACSFREGTERCNLRADAETFGQCVQCTGETEDEDCTDKSCKQSTGTCTNTDQGSRTACQSCETDSECNANRKCVQQILDDSPIGWFCLPEQTVLGCASEDNPAAQPFSVLVESALSIDSQGNEQQANYCAPAKTCRAVTDAIANVDCETEGSFDDALCGIASLEEGVCLQVSAAMGTCSYGCAADHECPQNKPLCSSNRCVP
jgi:hypothetical protein